MKLAKEDYLAAGNKLSKDQKREINKVLNGKDNLRPMLSEYNSSKGMRTAEQWKGTKLGESVHSDYMTNLDTI